MALLASPGPQVTPSATATVQPGNYITNFDFLNQYLPDIYADEFERYGNRTIASLLRLTGSEIPTNSDQIKWTEQGRLHTIYKDLTTATADAAGTSTFVSAGGTCNFRVNETVIISDNTTTISGKAVISSVTAATGTFIVEWYGAGGQPAGMQASLGLSSFVYGSEFRKGTAGMAGSNEADTEFFQNKPIIIKDHYTVSGSDMAQIGWVNISGEGLADGYYWFMKSEHDTRKRFEDHMEMGMIEGVSAENGSAAETYLSDNTGGNNAGTEGMFEAVESGGNVWDSGNPTNLSDWDTVVRRMDKQGSIRENVVYAGRDMSLDIDDFLAAQNSHGEGGTSFGMFSNSEQMALNLGFNSFRRGEYDFYKTSWKYLNDYTLRGGITGGKINGVLIPVGETSVYDQILGKNATQPFLHTKYRTSGHENRRYKTGLTGGAGGANTDNIDTMSIDFLTERALCTMGRNNFMLFKG